MMLPDKFLKNNCIENPADINRVYISIKVQRPGKPNAIFRILMEAVKKALNFEYFFNFGVSSM